jgi:hypothetical protein
MTFFTPRGTTVILIRGIIFCPLNNHLIVTGASPVETAQGTVTSSPSLRGRSPKVKGRIFGGTGNKSKALAIPISHHKMQATQNASYTLFTKLHVLCTQLFEKNMVG